MFSSRSFSGIGATIADWVRPPQVVYAHCDIPCGIYDPHEAQIAALTVVRMCQLIQELPRPSTGSKVEEAEASVAKLSRYMTVKEEHGERVKRELRILWADYFTAEHVQQHPTLHETFWRAMKLASKARQGTSLSDAQELLGQVQQIAEIFWKTKGATPRKVPSLQKSGGEIVLPIPA